MNEDVDTEDDKNVNEEVDTEDDTTENNTYELKKEILMDESLD